MHFEALCGRSVELIEAPEPAAIAGCDHDHDDTPEVILEVPAYAPVVDEVMARAHFAWLDRTIAREHKCKSSGKTFFASS